MPRMGSKLMNIVVLSLDSFGDQVLRQPLFTSLLDLGHSLTIVVRTSVHGIIPFIDPRLKILGTEIYPYAPPDENSLAQLNGLLLQIRENKPDLIVAAPYNRTYVDDWVLSRTQ